MNRPHLAPSNFPGSPFAKTFRIYHDLRRPSSTLLQHSSPHSRCLRGLPTPRTKHRSSSLSRTLQWTRYQPRCPTRQYALAAVTNIWISNFGELSDFPLMMLFAVYLRDLVASRSTSLTSIPRSFPSRSKEGLSYQYIVRFRINVAYQVHGEYIAFESCSC